MRISYWGCLKMITHGKKLITLVLKPRNQPGKRKYPKETTVTVVKNNCPINRYTSKYWLTRRALVYWQFSTLSNQPLYPQISVDVKNKSFVLNKNIALTYILLFFLYNVHLYWYLHLDKRLFTVLIDLLYIIKGNYIKKGEIRACQ